MWDEKKFFEDYVEESEKIKPDERFVEQLKQMAAQEEKKKKPIPIMKYAAIAASFVVCIGLGSVVWRNQSTESEDKSVEYDAGLQAGQQSTEENDFQVENDTASENKSETESENENPSEEEILTEALNSIKQGATIRDGDGNEVSQEKQEEIYQLLKNAKEAEAPEGEKLENSYFLEGDQTIEIEVWENGFLKVNGDWYQ